MTKKVLKNAAITVGVVVLTFLFSYLLQTVFEISGEHITTIFVFSVFIVSFITDGYIYGIISTFAGVVFVNYAFAYPYFALDFMIPANIVSAIVMITISLLTSTMTIKLKKWQALKNEGDKERMRANLLRAVSHDLRTPLILPLFWGLQVHWE